MADAVAAAKKLSPEETLELISILWDDLSATSENIPFPEWHKEELDRREAHLQAHPESALSWDEVRQKLKNRYGE